MPLGDYCPRRRRFCLQVPPYRLLSLRVATAPCRRRWPPFWAGPGRNIRPLARGLGRGLAMGGRPCMGAGRGSSPLLLSAFATKT
ncbi:hypothetical protein B296_00036633 [Ensete ventricosum]|uniref:Uncharacterized protein n=1 Tax=Ensete ventricosum TaxID=4639 RepID=A0A426X850_ENSVE|nr:hypothetical protein B296_00036633 [Ensete ventricosum]